MGMNGRSQPGALVISLDFELHWGVRDRGGPGGAYTPNVLGARRAIPRLLELFEDFQVSATWATVGFLFAMNRAEMEAFSPDRRPNYEDSRLSAYSEVVGEDEERDPLHYAGSLIEQVRNTPRQEVGTHTFSHYYCRERGQDREAFRADLRAAVELARRRNIRLRSIVFPRNQHNPTYDDILLEMGISSYRGNPDRYAWRFSDGEASREIGRRALRLIDAYLGDPGTTAWSEIPQPSGLSNVRASYPLRPFNPRFISLEPLRLKRIKSSIRHAARNHEVFHLWWHPHNFGAWTEENLVFLAEVLKEADRLAHSEGMLSLTMAEAADLARETCGETRMGRTGLT